MIRDSALALNGVRMDLNGSVRVTMHQYDKIVRLSMPHNDKEFTSRRASVKYIGVNCKSEICEPTQCLALGRDTTTEKEYKVLWKVINPLKRTGYLGLNFVPLYLEFMNLVLLRMHPSQRIAGLKCN